MFQIKRICDTQKLICQKQLKSKNLCYIGKYEITLEDKWRGAEMTQPAPSLVLLSGSCDNAPGVTRDAGLIGMTKIEDIQIERGLCIIT